MKFDRWYGLGGFALVWLLLSWQWASVNGLLLIFTLVFGLLGYGYTKRLLMNTTRRSRLVSGGLFILQALVLLIGFSLVTSRLVDPDFSGLYGSQVQPLLGLMWRLETGVAVWQNVFAALWPLGITILGWLLWELVAAGLDWQRRSLRRGLVGWSLLVIGLSLVLNLPWLLGAQQSVPTSLYLIPFALGSCLATRSERSVSRQLVNTPFDYLVALLLMSAGMIAMLSLRTLQSHWGTLAVLLLGSLITSWGLISAQTQPSTTHYWQGLRGSFVLYIIAGASLTLIAKRERLWTVGLALLVAAIVVIFDGWLYRKWRSGALGRQLGVQRRLPWIVGVAVMLVAILGSFSAYQAKRVAHPKPVTARNATGTAAKATKATKSANSAKQAKKTVAVDPVKQKAALMRSWRQIIDQQTVKVGVAVYDAQTKQSYSYTKDADGSGFYVASTIKAGILTELLHQRDQGNLTFTENEQTLAKSMIRYSDNAAATSLLGQGLGSYGALNNLYQQLGMTSTTANLTSWSMTKTTPADQVKLLRAIFYPSNYLSKQSKQTIQHLMGTVSDEQSWGVSRSAPDYQLKNGWMNLSDNGLGWQVNSIGHVYDEANDADGYVIAIYTNQDATMQDGVTLVEKLAAATRKVLLPN
ncbi:serine hydrolase [Lactiplantibacillus modestisalitolerans]|uniref:Serine hydrolase n=1 Tax=Lactiplantibacillus modestisalitolerans TaxID=1457219 RepID=A0ABV5WW53_9LACO|nr:serine hydrolase [Lactiplantibacillus modestisalitolerans]